jgi:hypothetical protein
MMIVVVVGGSRRLIACRLSSAANKTFCNRAAAIFTPAVFTRHDSGKNGVRSISDCKDVFPTVHLPNNNAGLATKEVNPDSDDVDDSLNKQRANQQTSAGNYFSPAKVSSTKWSAQFTPPNPPPVFKWKWLEDTYANPVKLSFSCCDLLIEDCFIDKSAVLYSFLKEYFNADKDDFYSVPLLVVYPRRFAKTTLLGFIEAIFSPVPQLDGYDAEEIKTKISALERGKELLSFGSRPVLSIDMQGVTSVMALKKEIAINLERAGLNEVDVNTLMTSSFSPADLLYNGVAMLNKKFMVDTGIQRNTIVLIDEYDKLFRDREVDDYIEKEKDCGTVKERKRTILALLDIFAFGKKKGGVTGISLFVLCGLTRMVGSGLSTMNNLVDVSRMTIYHGLCGISVRELVHCANGQLDAVASEMFDKSFEKALIEIFAPTWNGFRFGIDNKVGELNPNSPDGALFSPLDVWEIVESMVKNGDTPSPRWINTMESEFEFTSFARKYTSSQDGFIELFQNLDGGWVDAADLNLKMNREDYMLLANDLHVKKVLLELGLLSVKAIDDQKTVLLGSPNNLLTENALKILLQDTDYQDPSENVSRNHMSVVGFENIVSRAARVLTNTARGLGEDAVDELLFHSTIYRELSYRFPDKASTHYMLYKEVNQNEYAAICFDKKLNLINLTLMFHAHRRLFPRARTGVDD